MTPTLILFLISIVVLLMVIFVLSAEFLILGISLLIVSIIGYLLELFGDIYLNTYQLLIASGFLSILLYVLLRNTNFLKKFQHATDGDINDAFLDIGNIVEISSILDKDNREVKVYYRDTQWSGIVLSDGDINIGDKYKIVGNNGIKLKLEKV